MLLVGGIHGASTAKAVDEDRLDYNRDVRPILSENCFACHGFDEKARQADLRLDVAESALADREGVPAIVPGNPDESELWRRVTSEDEAELMPPPESHKTLTAEQKEVLRRWIEEGVVYAKHWSFIPPVKADLPEVSDESWVRNEIDRFVLARLEKDALKPAPEADRWTLVRRLSLDLTGLPPSAAEAEAFVEDDRPDAYEQLVERLLASPHYGERMALEWLDAARYADTNGYSIDGGRHMWLWRDWVIDAFNRNKPYDEFLVEQLAGDLLPEPSDANLIATGFQRNNMVTHEGGTIPEENLTNYNVDRVKTLGEAVLGLTLGCCQCHDHKYDPLTQRDYYRLYAYFNALSDQGLDGDRGRNPRPVFEAQTVLKTDELPELRQRIAAVREKLAAPNAAAVTAWADKQRKIQAERGKDFATHAVKLIQVSTPNSGAGFGIEDGMVRIRHGAELVAYDVSLQLPELNAPVTGLRIVFHPLAEMRGGGWGHGTLEDAPPAAEATPQIRATKGTFVLTSFSASAESVPGDQVNLHELLDIRRVTANCWDAAYRPEGVLDTRGHDGWSPDVTHDGPVHITVSLETPIDARQTPFVTTQLNFGHLRSLVAAKIEILAMTGVDDGSELPAEVIAAIETPDAERTDEQQQRLSEYFANHSEEMRALRVELANLEERVGVLTKKFPTMVMDEAEAPRETFILRRGDYSQPTEKVTSGTPEVLPALPEGAPASRLGLAQWATMRENPLTARVAVNRIWQMLFGAGIVRTPADFGAQGEWPTHPELLDWLAVDFVERGWDVKALVRQIVSSATYRQASVASDESLATDPANRLLARGARFRLPAELIRDSALKVSGLLVDRLGGPSVNPYTPGNLWREISHYGSTPATSQTFEQDHGEKLYRRSLYTYWKRTVPPPNMVVFDAPNRETCVVSRPATTTPLQALVLLNDVQFVEAARAFAERILGRDDDDQGRLKWALVECVSREPSKLELDVLIRALERERRYYQRNEAAATEYLSNGESARNAAIPVVEHAAWSQVASMLLNLSETVTRD
jgi:hypothetical protein